MKREKEIRKERPCVGGGGGAIGGGKTEAGANVVNLSGGREVEQDD